LFICWTQRGIAGHSACDSAGLFSIVLGEWEEKEADPFAALRDDNPKRADSRKGQTAKKGQITQKGQIAAETRAKATFV
jgi:hypothetical protein